MHFVTVERGLSVAPSLHEPVVILEVDSWDDYGFKTSFHVTILLDFKRTVELGIVKIIKLGQRDGRTDVPDEFGRLGDEFCSLGQDPDYYETLMSVPNDVRISYLNRLRDAAFTPSIERAFAEEPGWITSLLRFGQAQNALEIGRLRLHGRQKASGILSFEFHSHLGDAPLAVPFYFDDQEELPGRCNVVIGYNGVGKTRLLADLAIAASRVGEDNNSRHEMTLSGDDTNFGAVVAVSYSAFDNFALPPLATRPSTDHQAGRTDFFGYVYCGLRRVTDSASAAVQLKSMQEIEQEFLTALGKADKRRGSRGHLREALRRLNQEPSFGRIGVSPDELAGSEYVEGIEEEMIDIFRRLSNGHKVVINIVVQLAANLRGRSLLLIDEPETHLHPPLMAALLRAIQYLLDMYDSFAVIATHSPVVLQEIPARYVHVLERFGDEASVRPPTIETYGESIGEITRHVFSLDSSATDYQGVLARLARERPLEEIEEMFKWGLSMQGRALVLNYRNRLE